VPVTAACLPGILLTVMVERETRGRRRGPEGLNDEPSAFPVTCMGGMLLLGTLALPCQAEPVRPARVSDLAGTLSAAGDDEEVSSLDRNSVIREGDTLWTDRDSRAELELEHGGWIRLAESTKVEIRSLNGSPELRLWSGSLYFDLSARQRELLLDTPEGDVRIDTDSVVRVDLGKDRDARITVWSGQARVSPETGDAIRLRASERLYLERGRPTGDPARFDRDDRDAFDRYQRDRVDYYIDRPMPRELEQDLPGARDLNRYGTWVQVEQVRYWRPTCAPDWRPYSLGYWSVVPGWGYTWVDYHPWGYVTSHYGRWLYRPAHGWLWRPAYVWGPSWVYWSTSGDYYGWCPLDPWDRPCFYGPTTVIVLGLDIWPNSWTFCPRNRFHYGRHHWLLDQGHRSLVGWQEIRLRPGDFHPVRNVYDEIGLPRDPARGLTLDRNGRLARDRVLELERGLPASRLRSIQERFRVRPDRDRDRLQRPGEVERYQRAPWLDPAPDQILKQRDAERRIRLNPTPPRPGDDRPDPARERNVPDRRPGRDDPFRRTEPPVPRHDRTPAPGGTGVPAPTPGRSAPTPRAPGRSPRVPERTAPRPTAPTSTPVPGRNRMPGSGGTRPAPGPARPGSGANGVPRGVPRTLPGTGHTPSVPGRPTPAPGTVPNPRTGLLPRH